MQSLKNSSNVPLRGSAIFIGSWDDILNEWQKCILLCLNCHMEIHSSESN